MMLSMDSHDETWVKVNARVDRGIAPVISLLNEFEGLQTIDSCQGEPGGRKPAHVYFYYGNWQTIGHFMFESLGPLLSAKLADKGTASVEVFNGSSPMGKLQFEPEATDVVASVLVQLVKSAHNCACSDGTLCTEPRNC